MRVFQNKSVVRAAARENVGDAACRNAIANAEAGLIDARLGGGLIKQRIPREGGGKSGGFRSMIFYRRGELAIFLHLFAKSEKANITPTEKRALMKLAEALDGLDERELAALVETEGWREISDGVEKRKA